METITGTHSKLADRYAIDVLGIPSLELMENASRHVAEYIRRELRGKKILVACGTGNNGADGVCIARLIRDEFEVSLVIAGDLKKASWEFLYQLSEYKRIGGSITFFEDLQQLPQADVLVDAIFGIGLKGRLRPDAEAVLAKVDSMNYPHVVAVDVPSGIDADTGDSTGVVIPADVTITFGRNKTGLTEDKAGKVMVCDIGIPDEAYIRAGEML